MYLANYRHLNKIQALWVPNVSTALANTLLTLARFCVKKSLLGIGIKARQGLPSPASIVRDTLDSRVKSTDISYLRVQKDEWYT